MNEVTQWFDGKCNPVHNGEYQFYATWNARKKIFKAKFHSGCWHIVGSEINNCWLNYSKHLFKWRGLADKP